MKAIDLIRNTAKAWDYNQRNGADINYTVERMALSVAGTTLIIIADKLERNDIEDADGLYSAKEIARALAVEIREMAKEVFASETEINLTEPDNPVRVDEERPEGQNSPQG